ncbi:unnamed protein product [Merluccius merluccius]
MNPANQSGSSEGSPTAQQQHLFTAGTYQLLALAVGSIGLFGFCNNVTVLVLFSRFKRLRTPAGLLLVNISVSDVLVSVFGVNFTFVACLKGGWIWGSATCTWDGFSNSLFGIVSIMTLSALAYERYIRVVHAQVVDFRWAWRAIGHIWLYSLAWTGAPLLGWNRYTLEIHGLGCSLDWASKDPNDASFVLFFLLACFIVPVGIMIYCYGNILYMVRMLRSIEDLQTVQIVKILRYEKKVAAMFLLMISCYLVCWTPYAVVSMMEAFGRKRAVSPVMAIVPSFFAKSSTAYNPLIYILMNRKIRRCFLQLLCSRLSLLKRSINERPLAPVQRPVRPIRPIVMSHGGRDRPKKRVTFSSSSIVFIIASNDLHNPDKTSKTDADTSEMNVIQVRPL